MCRRSTSERRQGPTPAYSLPMSSALHPALEHHASCWRIRDLEEESRSRAPATPARAQDGVGEHARVDDHARSVPPGLDPGVDRSALHSGQLLPSAPSWRQGLRHARVARRELFPTCLARPGTSSAVAALPTQSISSWPTRAERARTMAMSCCSSIQPRSRAAAGRTLGVTRSARAPLGAPSPQTWSRALPLPRRLHQPHQGAGRQGSSHGAPEGDDRATSSRRVLRLPTRPPQTSTIDAAQASGGKVVRHPLPLEAP